MTLWVLVTMLFGYLTSFAKKGADFAVIMPLVMLAVTVPALWSRTLSRGVAVAAFLVVGFVTFVLGTHVGLRFADGLGPRVLETPLVMAAVWATVMLSSLTIARAVAVRYRRGVVVVTLVTVGAATLIALTLTPALFALGLTEYTGLGLYFGVPFGEHARWMVSALVAGVAGYAMFGEESALGKMSLNSGMLVVALSTGINIAHHVWLPAVLGLLLLQYGFSLRSTL